jgi:cytochrome c oxidase cbb3-type subunit 4
MDVNTLRGLITIVAMLAFFAIVWWAYRSANRRRFEEDARLPFADEADDSSIGGDPEQ